MDLSPAINQMMHMFWFLIPFMVLIAVLKSPWFKGVIGEFIVNVSAKLMLDKTEYHLIKNVTLPTEDGTTQIDHIIASVYGVFVVETKNMKGWIFGSQSEPMWTQKIYKHSNKFQNPLRQNYKHVKALKENIGLNDEQIHPLIVFVGDSTFKTEMPENVTHGWGYIRYVKSKLRRVLSPAEVEEIVNKIKTGRLSPSFKTHREHVKHVREIVKEKESGVTCPKCGGPMVMRESKKGQNAGKQFWGCSKFPQCRGVVNII